MRLSYAVAITLAEFTPGQRHEGDASESRSLVVYCLHEEQAARAAGAARPPITCVDCGLCMSDRHTIAFALHGTDAQAGRASVDEMLTASREARRLVVINND